MLLDKLFYSSFICIGVIAHMGLFEFMCRMNPGVLIDYIEEDTKLWHQFLKLLLCIISYWFLFKWSLMCEFNEMKLLCIAVDVLKLIPWVGILKYTYRIICQDKVKLFATNSLIVFVYGYTILMIVSNL